MSLSDEQLMAYVDGELDARARAEVEAALAADPALARRVAAHQALRNRLRRHFDPVLDERVPEHLLTAARAASAPGPDPRARVLPFARKESPRTLWRRSLPLAASFLLGVLAWPLIPHHSSSALIIERQGHLIAADALARALNEQLAGAQQPGAAVRIGLSYRSRAGEYCRTFEVRAASASAGLACQESGAWRVQVLAQGATERGGGVYRQAGSALPQPVLEAVDASISGEPLDAPGELAARDRHWRP